MKKLVLSVSLFINLLTYSQVDTHISFVDSVKFTSTDNQISQMIQLIDLYKSKEYKDHTHLRNNLMRIILSKDNSELFKSIDEGKDVFGSIIYYKRLNGYSIGIDHIVLYKNPSVTVYNTTILSEIINEIKLNYPKNKSFKPDDIDILECDTNVDILTWNFKNNKTEYKLTILFDRGQIQQITFVSNIIE